MTSDRQKMANQRNARLSSGPRTEAGKGRSAKNALRHGLSIPVGQNPAALLAIKQLAETLSGNSDDVQRHEYAYALAEAYFELWRIRGAQSEVLRLVVEAQTADEHATIARAVDKISRYKRRTLSKRKKASITYRSSRANGQR